MDHERIPPPCFNIATGILAARLGVPTDKAAKLLRVWYPDPTELHTYCAGLINDLHVRSTSKSIA